MGVCCCDPVNHADPFGLWPDPRTGLRVITFAASLASAHPEILKALGSSQAEIQALARAVQQMGGGEDKGARSTRRVLDEMDGQLRRQPEGRVWEGSKRPGRTAARSAARKAAPVVGRQILGATARVWLGVGGVLLDLIFAEPLNASGADWPPKDARQQPQTTIGPASSP